MKKIKRILASAAAVVMMTSSFVTSMTASAYAKGDVNRDGAVNYADYVCLLRRFDGVSESNVTDDSADVDGNGSINTRDLISLNSILNRKVLYVQGSRKIFTAGQTFLDNGTYWGTIQTDGNIVVYRRDGNKNTAIFSSGTNYGSRAKNYRLMFQEDGNIVLYATPNIEGAKEQPIWNSTTSFSDRTRGYALSFSANGQLEWYDSKSLIWTSNRSTSKFKEGKKELLNKYEVAKQKIERGYRYSNTRDAAIDFIYAYNKKSFDENAEFGAAIDKVNENGQTKYVVCEINKGWRNGHDGGCNILMWWETAAYVHVHGPRTCNENLYFSAKDRDLRYHSSAGHDITAYLGAPDGRMWESRPGCDDELIGSDAPRMYW